MRKASPYDRPDMTTDRQMLGLMEVCERTGKDFVKARRFASDISEGKLTMDQSIALVINVLTGGAREERGGGMSLEAAIEALEQELTTLEKQTVSIDEEISELEEQKQGAIEERYKIEDALARIRGEKPPKRSGSRRSAGEPKVYRREPCPWPECDLEVAVNGGARTQHNGRHERETGMTLEQALARVGNSTESAA